ncbi:MAG: autotransporter outer membrane beta-barrel domain-containing protein [Xanthobacteraceae bacterium]|nr:autotransporter outer membrane beta-barrel domain-containing protein [Xanthobacteraceae bacterium]
MNNNFIQGSVAGAGATHTSFVSNFAAGDVVTITVTRATAGSGTFRLAGANGANVFVDTVKGATAVVAYSVKGTTDTSLTAEIVSAGPQISISAVCRAGVAASQALRAMQVQLTPQVAITSGAAITGAVDTAIADAFSSSALAPITGGPGAIRFNLQPAADERERIPAAFEALSYADRPGQRAPVRRPERDWSVWVDGRGTRWVNDDGANEVRSTQINVTAGLSRKLGSDALVGLVMGYEDFRYDVASLDGNLKGHGWTAGAYGALRFTPQMRVDGTLAWSKVNYEAIAGSSSTAINGTASGVFSGDRLLASTGLTGIYPSSGFILEPSARIYVLWERQAAWTDSLGLEQAAREFTIGRASVGGKLSYPLPATASVSLTPYVGAYSDYRLSKDNAAPVDIVNLGVKDGLSGRVVTGFAFTSRQGATLAVGAELGGLGLTNQSLWTASARGVVPF